MSFSPFLDSRRTNSSTLKVFKIKKAVIFNENLKILGNMVKFAILNYLKSCHNPENSENERLFSHF